MHVLRSIISFLVLIFIIQGCREGTPPKFTREKALEDTEEFFLVSQNGDTIATGENIEVINPSKRLKGKEDGFDPGPSYFNLSTEYHSLSSNQLNVKIVYEQNFYYDSAWTQWTWKKENDTIQHPEAISTKGRTVLMENSSRERLLPPEYKETAIVDIQTISNDQGLISSNIKDILIDSRGITWIATDRGLVRFDGVYVSNYTKKEGLPSNVISSLAESENGEIWMGFLKGGFARYDGHELTIFDKKSCGFAPMVNDITINKTGDVLIGTLGSGICVYNGEFIKVIDKSYGLHSHKDVTSFTTDSDNNTWFINYGGGVFRYSKEDLRGFHNAAGIRSGWISAVFVDSKNRIWAGGSGTNFWMIESGKIIEYKVTDAKSSYIGDFIEDQNGNIWIATTHLGVLKYENGQIFRYGTNQGLSSDEVNSLTLDESGKIWVGTANGGISIINTNSFEYLSKANGLPGNGVYGISEQNDNTYYATNGGLAIARGDTITWASTYGREINDQKNFSFKSTTSSDVAVNPHGVILTSISNFGFARHLPHLKYVRRLGSNTAGMPQNPASVVVDKYGVFYGTASDYDRLWILTDTSVHEWGPNQKYAFRSSVDIEIDHLNRKWIGSYRQGVGMFDSINWYYYTTNEGLSSNNIRDIYIDNENRVWVATSDGLDFIEDEKVYNVTLDRGKYASSVQSILQDDQGGYWFGLFNSLIHLKEVKASEHWEIENYKIELISKNDGLINSSFLRDAMYKGKDGTLYFGTEGGLIMKKNHDSDLATSKPISALTSIDINSKIIDFGRANEPDYFEKLDLPNLNNLDSSVAFYNYPKTLELPFNCNHITFHYEGYYHGSETPLRLQYQYYVEGLDDDWINGPKEQKADYRNIPYGNYTFHLRSFIDEELPGEEFTYNFSILPPWYHTWWARFIFLCILIGIIWIVLKIRTRALLARQKELENTVEERTAELKEKHEQLEESHQEIKDSIAYAKRIQSAILPPQKLVKEYLPKSFVLYKPKDVVAGDFYWMAHADDKILFAAADCTGHGVPGAMVSVICNGGLNRSVNEFNITDPGAILDKTRELVIKEFEKSEEEVKDGMDIALCALKINANKTASLEYAGAHNALWIIRKGSEEIEEIKANKQPIGKFHDPKPFTTHKVTLEKGDSFYIFSDGYADQFGGERGKKFKSANFKRLLLSVQDKSLEEQRSIIDERFEDWKSHYEQVDDVCVIGVRV
ncbi:MAG: SpoIIE family protein phosphatase [Crocinitomicaceae bacterium]|nr:SpoIIE family protein phosphatase [Crocinitomicaceae bacterium]